MELWELSAREAIRDAIAQYTHSGDRARLDELADAFCEDGVLEIRGQDPVVGRVAIVERLRGVANPDAPAQRSGVRRIVRHNIANIRFESVTPEEATVASYFTVFTEVGLDHYGRYRDRFVPDGDRWRIKHRFVSTDWRAETSTFPRDGSGR